MVMAQSMAHTGSLFLLPTVDTNYRGSYLKPFSVMTGQRIAQLLDIRVIWDKNKINNEK